MKNIVYFNIAFRIILLSAVAMAITFITPHMREFFGDTPATKIDGFYSSGVIDVEWNWGIRHYWYYWTMIILFILSFINLIMSIAKVLKKHYPSLWD